MANKAKPGGAAPKRAPAGKPHLTVVETAPPKPLAAEAPESRLRRERADRMQSFQVHLAKARLLRAATDKAKAAVKEPADAEKVYRATIEAEGFPLSALDAIHKIDAKKDPRRSLAEFEDVRALMLEAAGYPVGRTVDQMELDLRMPDPARDQTDARLDGYATGLKGDPAEPPAWIHPTNHQDWLSGYSDGQRAIGESMKSVSTRPAPPAVPPTRAHEEEPAGDPAEPERAEREDDEPCVTCGDGDRVPVSGPWTCPTCDAEWEGEDEAPVLP